MTTIKIEVPEGFCVKGGNEMSEPLFRQCPYCFGNLTNGHDCAQMRAKAKEISDRYPFSPDTPPHARAYCDGFQDGLARIKAGDN